MTSMAYERLHQNMKNLKLETMEEIVDNYIELASSESKSVVEILDHLFEEEYRSKNNSAIETRLRISGIPVKKTLDEFNISFQPSLDPAVINELRTLRFVHNAESLVLLGPPGTGKTHLAIGLAIEAIHKGFSVFYTTASTLLDKLKKAEQRGQLDKMLKTYAKYKLLVIDEIGYLPMQKEGAHMFFQLVSKRYEKVATIFTSNKPYGEWGEIMGDPVIAAATLDRILHHSTTVSIKGESYRLQARRRAGACAPITNEIPGGVS